jgi:hypothetical protein
VLTTTQRRRLVDLVAGALHDVRRAGGSGDLADDLAALLLAVRALPVADPADETQLARVRETEGARDEADEQPDHGPRDGHGEG